MQESYRAGNHPARLASGHPEKGDVPPMHTLRYTVDDVCVMLRVVTGTDAGLAEIVGRTKEPSQNVMAMTYGDMSFSPAVLRHFGLEQAGDVYLWNVGDEEFESQDSDFSLPNQKKRASPSEDSLSLAAVAPDFLDYIDRRFAAGTITRNGQRDFHGGWQLIKVTPLAAMQIDRITTKSAETVRFAGGPWNQRKAQKTLARILRWAAEEGLITAAPRIKRTKAYGRTQRITPEVESRLLEQMTREAADVFISILDTGMRNEEVLRMRWQNVDWEKATYFTPGGKTFESQRHVPLSDRVITLLEKRLRGQNASRLWRGTPWVFPSKRGTSGHRTTIVKEFARAREAAGLPKSVVSYCGRHEFGSGFLEDGGDIATLMKIMGHTNLETTQKYLHPNLQGAAGIINQRNFKRLEAAQKLNAPKRGKDPSVADRERS